MKMIITKNYLREHPNEVFVFGDNTIRKGKGGATILRDEPNVYGFITKKYPNHDSASYYQVNEYRHVFKKEMDLLKHKIESNPDKKFLISKLGAGLANKYHIFESVIEPVLKKELENYNNILFLWI